MTYENFQNLGNEEKTQETGPGERKGGMESPECALSMSARVSAVVSHHAPVSSVPLRRPLHCTYKVLGETGTERVTCSDLASCALWEGMAVMHVGTQGDGGG